MVEQATGRMMKRLPVADLFAKLSTSDDAQSQDAAAAAAPASGGDQQPAPAASDATAAGPKVESTASAGSAERHISQPTRFRYKRVRTVPGSQLSPSASSVNKRGRRSGADSPSSNAGEAQGAGATLQKDGVAMQRIRTAPLSEHEKLFDKNIFSAFSAADNVTRAVQTLEIDRSMVNFQRRSSDDTSLLMAAARWGDIQAVTFLLTSLNADTSLRDMHGNTAENIAVMFGHHAVAEIIKKHIATQQSRAKNGDDSSPAKQSRLHDPTSSGNEVDSEFHYDVFELVDEEDETDDADEARGTFYVSQFADNMLLYHDDAFLEAMTSDEESSAGSDSNHVRTELTDFDNDAPLTFCVTYLVLRRKITTQMNTQKMKAVTKCLNKMTRIDVA